MNDDDDDDDHSKIRSPSSIHKQLHLPQSADTQDPLYKLCQKMHKAQQTQVFNYIIVSWSGSFISLFWLLYLHTTKPKMEEKFSVSTSLGTTCLVCQFTHQTAQNKGTSIMQDGEPGSPFSYLGLNPIMMGTQGPIPPLHRDHL